MRLATMTDYALRLLMYVAQQPERLCNIAEIAQAYGVSEAHLMKITHQLGRQGWLIRCVVKVAASVWPWRLPRSASGPWCAAWSPISTW